MSEEKHDSIPVQEVIFSQSFESRLDTGQQLIALVGPGQVESTAKQLVKRGLSPLDLSQLVKYKTIRIDAASVEQEIGKLLSGDLHTNGFVIPIIEDSILSGGEWLKLMRDLETGTKITKSVVFVVEAEKYKAFEGDHAKLRSMESHLEKTAWDPLSSLPSTWQSELRSRAGAKKPDYQEQLATIDKKLPLMGKLVYSKLTQLIRILGGEGEDDRKKSKYASVMKIMESVLSAYETGTGSIESRTRSMTTALGNVISSFPEFIADIFKDYIPVFRAFSQDEVVIHETNVKSFAVKEEWMIGVALGRAEKELGPLDYAGLAAEAKDIILFMGYKRK